MDEQIIGLIKWNLADDLMWDIENITHKEDGDKIWFVFRYKGEITHAKCMAKTWANSLTSGGFALMLLRGTKDIKACDIPPHISGDKLPFDQLTEKEDDFNFDDDEDVSFIFDSQLDQ